MSVGTFILKMWRLHSYWLTWLGLLKIFLAAHKRYVLWPDLAYFCQIQTFPKNLKAFELFENWFRLLLTWLLGFNQNNLIIVVVYDFLKSVVGSVDKVKKLHEDLETCAGLATKCYIKLKPKVLFIWLKSYLLGTNNLLRETPVLWYFILQFFVYCLIKMKRQIWHSMVQNMVLYLDHCYFWDIVLTG